MVDGAVSSQLARRRRRGDPAASGGATTAAGPPRSTTTRSCRWCWPPSTPTTIELGTSIAVAFARNPDDRRQRRLGSAGVLATAGSSSVSARRSSAHIENRFSMPWSRPVRRMREFVLALHEIWSCWQDGTRLCIRRRVLHPQADDADVHPRTARTRRPEGVRRRRRRGDDRDVRVRSPTAFSRTRSRPSATSKR